MLKFEPTLSSGISNCSFGQMLQTWLLTWLSRRALAKFPIASSFHSSGLTPESWIRSSLNPSSPDDLKRISRRFLLPLASDSDACCSCSGADPPASVKSNLRSGACLSVYNRRIKQTFCPVLNRLYRLSNRG